MEFLFIQVNKILPLFSQLSCPVLFWDLLAVMNLWTMRRDGGGL